MNAITAVDNYEIIKKIKKESNVKIVFKNLEYREAILEFLEENKKIDFIYISEKIPGEISIEKLIKKIKLINKKINIIFFLEKEDEEKEKELNRIGIRKIYIKNKFILKKNKIEKIKNNKINNLKNSKKNKIKNTKIITIEGKKKTGKTTIINLIEKYLINDNKKILKITLDKKNEKNFLKVDEKNNFKIGNNIKDILNTKEKKYDYILIDIGNECNFKLKKILTEKSDKKLLVIDQSFLGIKGISSIIKKRQNGLHIVYNKYKHSGISKEIITNLLEGGFKIYKFYYNKNYENLGKVNSKITNFEIDNKNKKQLKKIFNNY